MPRFFVLEDYAPLADALERMLKDMGEVRRAATAAEAAKVLRETRDWSGLLVDILLPDGNGLDVLAFARDLGYATPAVVFSAVHEPEAINRAFDLGARYLVKPSSPDLILAFARNAAQGRPTEHWAHHWGKIYGLTLAETTILAETADGVSREALIQDRGIAHRTFKKHVQNLLRKTGDTSLMAASMRLLREHIH